MCKSWNMTRKLSVELWVWPNHGNQDRRFLTLISGIPEKYEAEWVQMIAHRTMIMLIIW